jgi:hypothetical protein
MCERKPVFSFVAENARRGNKELEEWERGIMVAEYARCSKSSRARRMACCHCTSVADCWIKQKALGPWQFRSGFGESGSASDSAGNGKNPDEDAKCITKEIRLAGSCQVLHFAYDAVGTSKLAR